MKRLRPVLELSRRFAPAILASGTAACALVHLTVRDRWPGFSMFFYASPPVAMAVVLLAAASIWAFRKSWRPAIASGGGALVAAAWWLSTSLILAPPEEGPAPRGLLRAMGWNTERGVRGWEGIVAGVKEVDPDLAWFGEAAGDWHAALAGYDRREMEGGIALIVKGRIRESRPIGFPNPYSHGALFRLTLAGADVTMILVDLDGAPWRHREDAFDIVNAAIASAPPGPLIVGGDFNTPRDSVFFEPWRAGMKQSFECGGRGMDGTWPALLPFLSIDHCWVNDPIQVRRCRLLPTSASDHRPVVMEFTIGSQEPR